MCVWIALIVRIHVLFEFCYFVNQLTEYVEQTINWKQGRLWVLFKTGVLMVY